MTCRKYYQFFISLGNSLCRPDYLWDVKFETAYKTYS